MAELITADMFTALFNEVKEVIPIVLLLLSVSLVSVKLGHSLWVLSTALNPLSPIHYLWGEGFCPHSIFFVR